MKETFLCAKYSYKDDIAVKQKEAFEDGQKDGIIKGKIEGSQQKAIEVASKAIAMKLPVDQISEMTGLLFEKIQELQGKSVSKK